MQYARTTSSNSIWTRNLLPMVCGLIVPCLLVWMWHWAVSTGKLPVTLVPEPLRVYKSLVVMWKDGTLQMNATSSATRLFTGFALGTLAGIAVGVPVATSKLASLLFKPTVSALAPVPPLAWGPLLIIWFGIDEQSKFALIAVGTFFVIFTGVLAGIRRVDWQLIEVAQTLQKSKMALIWHVLLPSSIPSIFTSMRVALALSWTLLMGAEMLGASKGLGWLLQDARNFSRPDDMIAAMVAIGVLGKCSDLCLLLIEQRCTSWERSFN